jgi:hypothetical protein
MLGDLYVLETFYGAPESAQFFSDLAKRYGQDSVEKSLKCGDIEGRPINIGPDTGRRLIVLTEQGRQKALGSPFPAY